MEYVKPAAITDAAVCFDLSDGGLFDALLWLNLQLIIPDAIAKIELKSIRGDDLLAAGFRIEVASGAEVAGAEALGSVYPGLSLYDRLALAMAIVRRFVLLTGDGCLRNAAVKEGVTVIGTLGLLDRLESHLPASRLVCALERIMARHAFLPVAECEKRLHRWRLLS